MSGLPPAIKEKHYLQTKKWFEQQEQYIKLHVRLKPWWIPQSIYHAIISRILVLDLFKKGSI